jgi:hypothetical protein
MGCCHVERRAHALANLAIPRVPRSADGDAGVHPVAQRRCVGAGAVAARYEQHLGLGDAAERLDDILAACHMNRISGRSDDDEIVVHQVVAVDAEALSHEFFFRRSVVDEHRISAPANIERPTATTFNLNACLRGKGRQQKNRRGPTVPWTS